MQKKAGVVAGEIWNVLKENEKLYIGLGWLFSEGMICREI